LGSGSSGLCLSEQQKANGKKQTATSGIKNLRAFLASCFLLFAFCFSKIPPQTSGLSEQQKANGKKQTATSGIKNLRAFLAFCSLLFAFQKSHRKHQVFSNKYRPTADKCELVDSLVSIPPQTSGLLQRSRQ